MSPFSKKAHNLSFVRDNLSPFRIARKVTLIYTAAGALWILFSDKLASIFVADKDSLTFISMIKGWFYITVTAAVLFTVIFNYIKRIQNSEAKLLKSYTELEEANSSIRKSREELEIQYKELKLSQEALEQSENEKAMLNLELEQRVKDRTTELNAAIKEIEAFNYSVSHDLRAPIRSIDGFSQILYDNYYDCLDESGQRYLQKILLATKRMGTLIDELLNLSRLGRSEIKLEEVNLSEMVKGIFEQLRESDSGRNVEVKYSENVIALCDKQLILAVMENLIGNAWKFTGKHEKAKIEFGTLNENEKTVYFVKDDGAGFNMEHTEKLFKPFQRLHRIDEFDGTGIGLANVYRIIRKHNGNIWAFGEEEKGAVFYFTLE